MPLKEQAFSAGIRKKKIEWFLNCLEYSILFTGFVANFPPDFVCGAVSPSCAADGGGGFVVGPFLEGTFFVGPSDGAEGALGGPLVPVLHLTVAFS